MPWVRTHSGRSAPISSTSRYEEFVRDAQGIVAEIEELDVGTPRIRRRGLGLLGARALHPLECHAFLAPQLGALAALA